MTTEYHIPVMLRECLEGLAIKPEGRYMDVTFGGGGHSRAILKLLTTGKLIAFDRDEEAIRNVPDDDRLIFVHHNFQYFKNFLKYFDLLPLDGILADLGVSSHQFDTAERGFSFRYDAALDMRMDAQSEKSAMDILNKYSAAELERIFREYGEFRKARRLAAAIVEQRGIQALESTNQLKEIATPFLERNQHNKGLAQVFQALRIEVNGEMNALREFLEAVPDVLRPGGRLVVLTYHSLEDRMVKNFIQKGNTEGKEEKDLYGNLIRPLQPLNRKPGTAGADELENNPRSRSAKLRIAERI